MKNPNIAWGIFKTYPFQLHIRPVDEEDHVDDMSCKCEPKKKIENGVSIISHNSFDGREALEEAMEVLKKI